MVKPIVIAMVLILSPLAGAQSVQQAVIEKARSLENRGLTDLAAQTWQQVLLAQPDNTEALAGLARAAKKEGKDAEAARLLDRLRRLDPRNPQIAAIAASPSDQVLNSRRAQAEALTSAHDYSGAMAIYRQIFGDRPPDNVALEYYDTEAATEAGSAHAIAGLRALAKLHPRELRYQVVLGRVLSYKPKTRAEGEAILQQFPQDAAAQSALRQALLWDAQNPASATAIKRYLSLHPDQQLAQDLQQTEALGQPPSGLAANPAEQAAYAALQANRVDRAEQAFQALLQKEPRNPRALAGLGFVHMKQQNFDQAVSDFEAAQQAGLKDHTVESALDTARFWRTMGDASQALDRGQLDVAALRYREALARRPASPEAMGGLAGTLLRAHNTSEAVLVYARWVKVQPGSVAAWRGLFLATAQNGQPEQALALIRRFPGPVVAALAADPEYLPALASAYRATGDEAAAVRTLEHAMQLPFADDGKTMTPALRLQYAALLAAAGRHPQAAGLYREVISRQPENVEAWRGLILAQHLDKQDADAVDTVEHMPRTAYDVARRDPGFLSLIAAAYQQQGRLQDAQQFLEQAEAMLSGQALPPSVAMELQMASIERQLNQSTAAAALYRRVLQNDPRQPEALQLEALQLEAWNGLLQTLHQAGDDERALSELKNVPAKIQDQLYANDDYLLTLSAVYSATGHAQMALNALSRLRAGYTARHGVPPASVEMQISWLLLGSGDETGLYRELMSLGGRNDLTDEQRRQVQTIWATWSVRRAAQAVAAGNNRRALVILSAAKEALGGNEDVSRTLAGGYLTAGDAPSALAIYQSIDLASAADYQGGIGAALAAKNLKLAEDWLRVALELYPRNPEVLGLAARFEQARGDHGRARDYWKASLALAPATGAAERLAKTLKTPAVGSRPGAALPARETLATLLAESTVPPRSVLLPGESEAPPVLTAESDPAPTGAEARPAEPRPAAPRPTSRGGKLGDYQPQTDAAAPGPGPLTGQSSLPSAGLDPSSIGALDPSDSGSRSPAAQPAEPLLQDPGGRLTLRYAAQAPKPQPPGLSDDQLVEAQLPALSRNFVAVRPALTARQQAQQQIASIDGGFSPWVGGTGDVRHRTGTPGFDQLTSLEAPFEVSTPLGMAARLTFITTPVFLDAGQADGTSTLFFGSLPAGKIQPQQYADGVASELQLTAVNFAARLGETPYGFLVTNVTGGFRWRPAGGPLTVTFSREGVKDTQLSYSGLRDPGSATPTFDGKIWGGVIANSGDAQIAHGDTLSGFYVGVGGQYITGQHVLTNTRVHGNAGAYWRVLDLPDLGTLVLGANFFGMHYAHNLRYFTYGQGGYFSPEAYFLAAMPLSWTGHYGTDLHYTVTGSIGAQSFQENSEPFFPLDPGLQAAFENQQVPVRASVGANYDLQTEIAYRLQDHWYVGGFLDFNNTRDYESQTGGFFVRYLFRPQADSEQGPIGAFPRDGYRPVMVP